MRKVLAALAKRYVFHKAVVLLYHRIASLEQDMWDIAVTPENFEQHLQVLKQGAHVLSLPELMGCLQKKRLPRNAVAITFDDGYADNFEVAKPLLEKYGLPATFFIASGNIGGHQSFWWDEVEHLILAAPELPNQFSMQVGALHLEQDLTGETTLAESMGHLQKTWKAATGHPPTKRCNLLYELWDAIKPLPHTEQQRLLQAIRDWIITLPAPRTDNRSMTEAQLHELGQHTLFTIGAHTVTHPALAHHPMAYQKWELAQNKQYLERITGQRVALLAYPYGNYNGDTLQAVQQTELEGAFTTCKQLIYARWHRRYELGRFEVANSTGPQFYSQLQQWFYQTTTP